MVFFSFFSIKVIISFNYERKLKKKKKTQNVTKLTFGQSNKCEEKNSDCDHPLKSRIRETPTLWTDADSRTNTKLRRLRDLSNFSFSFFDRLLDDFLLLLLFTAPPLPPPPQWNNSLRHIDIGLHGSDLGASKNYICTIIGQLKWLGKSFYWCGCFPLSEGTFVVLVNVSIQYLVQIQLHNMVLFNGRYLSFW